MGTKTKKSVRKKPKVDTSADTAAQRLAKNRRNRQTKAVNSAESGKERAKLARSFLKKNQGKRKRG